jgi:biopolymer transport protein TolR
MRHARRHTQLKWITEVSVTPLLDLVFILLFAFMVALPLVSRSDHLLDSSPPLPQSLSPAAPADVLTLSLLSTGSILWDKDELQPAALESRLLTALESRPGLGVILEMAPDLPVSRLSSVMGTLNSAGVRSTAIRLLPASP